MKDYRDAYEGEWDFDGACAPPENGGQSRAGGLHETFTLGCFQWVRRGKNHDGTTLKKGRVVYRIKGRVSDPKPAYEAAREYCAKWNAHDLAKQKIKNSSSS